MLKSPTITSLDSFRVEDEKSLNSFKKNTQLHDKKESYSGL